VYEIFHMLLLLLSELLVYANVSGYQPSAVKLTSVFLSLKLDASSPVVCKHIF